MFFCNECVEVFHPKCVIVKPSNDDRDPMYHSWICTDCKYIIEKNKKRKRESNDNPSKGMATEPFEEIEAEPLKAKKN